MKKTYACVRVKQVDNAKELLLFSAPADDIGDWVGIPQRLSFGAAETAGFQRTVSQRREDALRKFFSVAENVIQNPLLCAIRQAPGLEVAYVPSDADPNIGHVDITATDLTKIPITKLLRSVRKALEQRVPGLADRPRPEELIASIQGALALQGGFLIPATQPDEGLDADSQEDADQEQEAAEEALFDESQITEFWDELYAREVIADKIPDLAISDQIQGFSRGMLESYLKPVILVDGQHRLTGAILAAHDAVSASEEAKALINDGVPASEVRKLLISKFAKRLPVSLLMNESPAEHVFQYVVVNQKATPVPKALLGTIISTSLAAGELATVAKRLEDAEIPLEGSRIISILSRDHTSPFFGLVAKGMDDEAKGKIPWSVVGSLAEIFRDLEGARFYHDPVLDHAKTWRNHLLEKSKLVEAWQASDHVSAYDYWRDINGPWLPAFKAFWTATRGLLASMDNPDARNYWGNPRESNIFNKPSLHILTADFFCHLREMKTPLDSIEAVTTEVASWLEYATPQYFARDWKLAGVKKDSVGTRKQWSKLWANYRRTGGTPPPPSQFSQVYKAQ
ncbi:hypothetical protein [uncultured Xylophilus sp.]|uniref:hypothetical protein n=1 Tax=uncultured Xylophilus sp. TaxID=296832 RepID=UPI0025D9CE35|nr:hypothetical protein [uncultured Xylophilus sp.]